MAGVRWERYREAVVRLHLPSGPVLLVPAAGVHAPPLLPPEGADGPISVVTAHNPGGRVVSDSANRRAHRDLVARLDRDGVSHHPAAGGDRDWVHVEEGVALIGIDTDATVALGRDLGQEAVFVWTREGFSLVDCATGEVVSRAWTVAPTPPALARVNEAYRALGLATPYVSLATAYAALDRALVGAAPDEARRLNALYLELASDYYRPRDAEEARRREAERVLEAERRAFREARARAREA
ncbi:DUF3293 domain-containing protein, partial [Intrasporangium oryzae]|uniref:DUF3293 domain-containing protein n=1 Tax=Intrasporangium oryzae TaxID=412687 RepID=UPI00055205C0